MGKDNAEAGKTGASGTPDAITIGAPESMRFEGMEVAPPVAEELVQLLMAYRQSLLLAADSIGRIALLIAGAAKLDITGIDGEQTAVVSLLDQIMKSDSEGSDANDSDDEGNDEDDDEDEYDEDEEDAIADDDEDDEGNDEDDDDEDENID